jgi:hypothetical protein
MDRTTYGEMMDWPASAPDAPVLIVPEVALFSTIRIKPAPWDRSYAHWMDRKLPGLIRLPEPMSADSISVYTGWAREREAVG